MQRKTSATLELVLAGAIWGFGFVATVWALSSWAPLQVSFMRFLIAAIAGLSLSWLKNRALFNNLKHRIKEIKIGLMAGSFLGATLLLQTIGLKYTSASNSGFITTLYIIEVPLLAAVWLGHKIGRSIVFSIMAGLLGTYLLVDADIARLNYGDIMTFLCSITAATHIVFLGRVAKHIKDPFEFNNWQSIGAFLTIGIIGSFHTEPVQLDASLLSWISLIFISLVASVYAFTLQIKAQKTLSPTTSSLLFLLESPFAALFAFLFLNEQFTGLKIAGALLIIAAGVLAVKSENQNV
jgi:drug/metabolite transporter (DMT)-like permease